MKKNLVWFRWNCEKYLLRNLINIISLSFPFFAFHYSFIFIFNFSVFWPLQSYLRLLVTSFLRDLKTPWQSGWRIWQNTVSNSVLGEWKFFDGLHRGIKIVSKMFYPPGVSELSWCSFAPHCTKQENRDTQGNNILIKPLHKGECDSKGLLFV